MDAFLVIGLCAIDDVPMYLCEDKVAATTFAAAMTPEKVASAAGRVLGVDVSMVSGVDVVEFKAGRPQCVHFCKTFD